MTSSPARLALFFSLSLAGLITGCARDLKPTGRGQETVPVVAGVVRTADVPVALTAIGSVEPYSTVPIKSMVGGELVGVHFQEGQSVRRGAVIFTIDARSYDAAVQQAEATLARDAAQLQNARKEEQRYAELVAKDYVTQEDYERTRTTAAALEATVNADKAALENARVELDYCTIRAPIDGVMGKLLLYRGAVLKANDVPLVTINQVRPVKVAFAVPESQLPEIRRRQAEQKLHVEAAPPGAAADPAVGVLDFIDNTVDRSAGTILLKGLFPNQEGALWPGQFVNVRLLLSTRVGATLAPSSAIQTSQQGTFVFVVKPDSTVEQRPVTIGDAVGADTIIEKGLAAGERIVTEGQLRLVPGSRVEIKNEKGQGS
jgi:multidrug efflux system membrane fusion protein